MPSEPWRALGMHAKHEDRWGFEDSRDGLVACLREFDGIPMAAAIASNLDSTLAGRRALGATVGGPRCVGADALADERE